MVSFVHVTSLVSVKNRFQTNLVDKDHFQQIFENLVLIHSKYNRIELFTITTFCLPFSTLDVHQVDTVTVWRNK